MFFSYIFASWVPPSEQTVGNEEIVVEKKKKEMKSSDTSLTFTVASRLLWSHCNKLILSFC